MSLSRVGPFIFVAIIVVGGLVSGIWLSVYAHGVPSLVVAVVLACAVSSLLYGILGGVGASGFEMNSLKMGASAVVLIGSAYLFNVLLEPQLEEIRGQKALENARFDLDRHVVPAKGWFAIDQETAAPVTVKLIDPVSGELAGEIKPSAQVNLRLELKEQKADGGYLISGMGAGTGLGYITRKNVENILGSLGDNDSQPDMIDLQPEVEIIDMEPGTIYGPKRLYLVNRVEELSPDKPRKWGKCLDAHLPLSIRVKRFENSYTDYEIRPCGSDEVVKSSLRQRQGELHKLKIGDELRSFVVMVVAANHQVSPFWSSFVVVEVVQPGS